MQKLPGRRPGSFVMLKAQFAYLWQRFLTDAAQKAHLLQRLPESGRISAAANTASTVSSVIAYLPV